MSRPERRAIGRRVPDVTDPTARLRLRTGHELRVLDISDRSARVEGARLLPGTRVEVHVETPRGRVPIRSRVVRSHVCRLSAGSISYQSVLLFEDTDPAGRLVLSAHIRIDAAK